MLRTFLALVLFAALNEGAMAAAQTPDARPAKTHASPTWDHYLKDLTPNIEQGYSGMSIDPDFWDEWDGRLIEWTGTFNNCRTSKNRDGREVVSCTVNMPSKKIAVVKGAAKGKSINIESVVVQPRADESARWQSLTEKTRVKFSAKTPPTIFSLPKENDDKDIQVFIILTDGHLK